jgi:hypothetical protein
MLGDILHPAINWADKESNVDADEMAKVKTAFVGNLPANVNEEYLRKLFEQFGKVGAPRLLSTCHILQLLLTNFTCNVKQL